MSRRLKVAVLALVGFALTAGTAFSSCGCNDVCVGNTCERRPLDGSAGCSGMMCATDPGDPSKCVGEFHCFEALPSGGFALCANMTWAVLDLSAANSERPAQGGIDGDNPKPVPPPPAD